MDVSSSRSAAVRDARALRALTWMLTVSGYLWAFTGVMGLLQLVGFAVGKVPVSKPEDVPVAAVFAVVGLAKGYVELKGRSMLRRPGAAVTPGLRVFVWIWLPAFVLAAANLVFMAVALAVLIAGVMVGVFGTIFTLGLAWRKVWDNPLWDLSGKLWGVLEAEAGVFEAITREPAGAVAVLVVLGAILFGPTVAALMVLRRGAS